ncbi:hypothetical protein ACIGBK_21265 [Streptomyces microflavus]|uniref:hypothetical protein n=1 Tax=Streptomyces microflavus TaxID=1919 RepID=UPI0037CD0547
MTVPFEGPVRISVSIMTHPRRLALAEELREQLSELTPRIVVDPDPDGPPTAVRTAAAAWSSAPVGATHHLVLQDDLLPSKEFLAVLTEEVRSASACCLSLYAGWSKRIGAAARLAAVAGKRRFVIEESFIPAPALLLPADLARDAGAYLDSRMADAGLGDSTLLRDFLQERGTEVQALTASLVQHDVRGSASLLAQSAAKGIRRVACFRDDVGGTVDLDGLLVRQPALAYVAPDSRRAVVDVALPDGSWKSSPAAAWLEDRGLRSVLPPSRAEAIRAAGGEVIATPEDLREAWLATFCMGLLAGPAGRSRTSVGSVALRTLLPGAFRMGLSDRDVTMLADTGGPLLDDALESSQRV